MATALASAEAHFKQDELEDALEQAQLAFGAFNADGGDVALASRAVYIEVMTQGALGNADVAEELARRQLKQCRAGDDRRGEALMLLALASAPQEICNSNKQEEALRCAQEACAIFCEVADRTWEVEALLAMSRCAAAGENKAKGGKEAVEHASRARDIAAELNDTPLEVLSLQRLATSHAAASDPAAALRAIGEALDLCLEARDKRLEASTLLVSAAVAPTAAESISDAEDALEIYQAVVRSPREIDAVRALFNAHRKGGDSRRALRTARQAVKRFRSLGWKAAEAQALDLLVGALSVAGQADDALEAAARASSLFQALGNRRAEARVASAIAGLHLQLGGTDRALQAGEDAALLLRESGGTTEEKTEAMFHVVQAYTEKGDLRAALEAATEMQEHFNKQADRAGESAALMTLCQVLVKMGSYADALSAGTRAQVLLTESGSQYGEAAALRMLSEVYALKEDFKSSVRAAERARAVFRETGDRACEAHAMYAVASGAVSVAVGAGAKAGAAGQLPKAATDAINKATKACEMVLKAARDMPDENALLGSGLCVQAQLHMFGAPPRTEEALSCADEAVVLFRDARSDISEANALLLSSDALRVLRKHRESEEAAREALRLFERVGSDSPHSGLGVTNAKEVLEYLDDVKQQEQQRIQVQRAMAARPAGAPIQAMPAAPAGDAPQQSVSVATQDRPRGPALDLTGGFDIQAIKIKVLEIAARITGAEDGEIDPDTPLMEAGLTSNSAILMRDELSQELPGVSLPVTLVFDYPSIAAMADLIMENSGAGQSIAG